jgi:hypothetical protein
MGRMAGYSGAPLPKKLGIKPGSSLRLVGAPAGFLETLGELPWGVEMRVEGDSSIDTVVCFVTEPEQLEERFTALKGSMDWAGGLWMAWPKRKPGQPPAALTENLIRDVGLAAGLVDNKVCAIDETWSGLRFVYRLADRPAAPASRARQRV